MRASFGAVVCAVMMSATIVTKAGVAHAAYVDTPQQLALVSSSRYSPQVSERLLRWLEEPEPDAVPEPTLWEKLKSGADTLCALPKRWLIDIPAGWFSQSGSEAPKIKAAPVTIPKPPVMAAPVLPAKFYLPANSAYPKADLEQVLQDMMINTMALHKDDALSRIFVAATLMASARIQSLSQAQIYEAAVRALEDVRFEANTVRKRGIDRSAEYAVAALTQYLMGDAPSIKVEELEGRARTLHMRLLRLDGHTVSLPALARGEAVYRLYELR